MTEEKAGDLLNYLDELWLSTPLITKSLLESNGLTHIHVRGQIAPTDTDLIKFYYNLNKVPDGFSVVNYNSFITDNSPIQHVKNNLVDSDKTEKAMKGINWNQSYNELKDKNPAVEDIINEVLFLKLFNQTKDIADKLMIKYWFNTPMQEHVNLDVISGIPMPKVLSLPLTGNFTDVDLKEAFALLSGRAVMKVDTEGMQPGVIPTPHWLVYEDGKLQQLPAFEMDKVIRSLSHQTKPDEQSLIAMMTQLIKGELAPAKLIIEGKPIEGYLEADPRAKNVRFYDEQGNKIELNHPSLLKAVNETVTVKTNQRNISSQKKKGPSL
ncbi:hypothetical protein [Chitinophaga sp. OAE865]|uniref:hypothetical protein n=1 Tax=Chitinophaga sp. OAE865 TaxID=2817898 RepID=UPI001AEB5F95